MNLARNLVMLACVSACHAAPHTSPSPTGLGYDAPVPRRAVATDSWRDPAPHRPLGVNVAPGVKLHVLDFGGRGTPLVFLTGIGNNAHVFDDFAQRFTANHRVIAITRRGFGESSHPESGYDQPTLAADVRAVMDSLGIQRAFLAGHSIGGYEITHFAASYPERTLGIIYLDAGTDPFAADSIRRRHADAIASLSALPKPPQPQNVMPSNDDSASAAAAWAYRQRVGLIDNTESAVRAAYYYEGFNPYLANNNPSPGRMLAAIRVGGRTPFAKVSVPSMLIYAARDSIQHQPADVQKWAASSSDNTRALQQTLDVGAAVDREIHQYVANELKNSRLITIPGARHLIFLTHPDLVAQYMNEFMDSRR
jgi:pimeloyl-ACP methyl ester carboxylesterase